MARHESQKSVRAYRDLKRYLDRHPEMQDDILRLRQAELVTNSRFPDLDSQSEMWCWQVLSSYGKR